MAVLRNLRVRRLCVILMACTGAFGFSFLDGIARRVKQGNQHFERAEFDAALEAYREAQTDRPDAPELHYNVGDALYKQGAVEEAMAAFLKAVENGDSGLASKAYYNLGNVLYRQQTYDQAVAAYEKSLELNPSDRDAKVNLEMALEKLEEQQEKEENQGQNKDQNQKEDQDQEDEQEENQEGPESESGEQKEKEDGEQDGQNQEQKPSDENQDQQQKPEEAERLLDAMKDRETESQKRRRVRLQGKRYRGKPW